MKIPKYLIAAVFILTFAAVAHAAPVGLTSEADATEGELWADKDIGLTIGFLSDFVSERKIDIDSGEFEMDAFLARIGLSLMDRFNVYIDIGQATDMEFHYVISGDKHVAEFDDELMWGVGVSALIYRWDNGLEVGTNFSYRTAETDLDKTSIDGTSYTTSQLTDVKTDDYEEIQAALELAWRTGLLTPYIGVKFSEVEVGTDYTLTGVQYDASGKNSDQNIGAFVGLEITPKLGDFAWSERLAINVEGRFIDEEAISAGISYKF